MERQVSERNTNRVTKRLKRQGPDESDVKWLFSKIHGLENIAYVPDEDLKKSGGDPQKL